MIRSIFYEHLAADSSVATVQHVRELLVSNTDRQGYSEHSNTLICSICRAVFNHCQNKVVEIKEASELDDDKQLDDAEEAALAAL